MRSRDEWMIGDAGGQGDDAIHLVAVVGARSTLEATADGGNGQLDGPTRRVLR